jgi:hypothetical protein
MVPFAGGQDRPGAVINTVELYDLFRNQQKA